MIGQAQRGTLIGRALAEIIPEFQNVEIRIIGKRNCSKIFCLEKITIFSKIIHFLEIIHIYQKTLFNDSHPADGTDDLGSGFLSGLHESEYN